MSSHIGAAIAAGAELAEDVEAIFEKAHHGHGMLLLVGSKLCREVNTLRESAVETVEASEGCVSAFERFASAVWRLLTSRIAASVLAIGALTAAALEVIEDVSPGGHHGAVLLAFNELFELIEGTRLPLGQLRAVLENHLLRVSFNVGAFVFAGIETVSALRADGFKLGGHHGVALLALSKLFKTLGPAFAQVTAKEE